MTKQEKQVITDKWKINEAVAAFGQAMLDRMLAKYDEGLRDWDNIEGSVAMYNKKLGNAAIHGKWVDVANFAMMLHNTEKK
jgi:hypothetical protein